MYRKRKSSMQTHIYAAQHSTVSAAGIQNSKLGDAASFCLLLPPTSQLLAPS